jgi:hypothetical protein
MISAASQTDARVVVVTTAHQAELCSGDRERSGAIARYVPVLHHSSHIELRFEKSTR